ncbi:MAG: hypothetical protein K0U78_04925 [Actinomycetia bacterium]|nr:hypothetical protein [Actinomycetes bacterium]
MTRTICMTFAVALAGLAVGCASSPESSAPASESAEASPPSPTSSSQRATVGGMTSCTKAELAEAATGAAQAMGAEKVYTINDLTCADGWAVTAGILANSSDPSMGAPTSFVFEQEGQFWVLQDKAKVCGTMPTSTIAPSDATIPAALFVPGCAAG